MKIVPIFVLCFSLTVLTYERLGTELLHADRYICINLRSPVYGEASKVLEKIKYFIKYFRRLRELRIDLQKKRATRITDALFDQGRPKFLQMDFDSLIPELKQEFGWTNQEVELLDELIAEADRVRGELYRKYKYSIYLKYSTRKPLPF